MSSFHIFYDFLCSFIDLFQYAQLHEIWNLLKAFRPWEAHPITVICGYLFIMMSYAAILLLALSFCRTNTLLLPIFSFTTIILCNICFLLYQCSCRKRFLPPCTFVHPSVNTSRESALWVFFCFLFCTVSITHSYSDCRRSLVKEHLLGN